MADKNGNNKSPSHRPSPSKTGRKDYSDSRPGKINENNGNRVTSTQPPPSRKPKK